MGTRKRRVELFVDDSRRRKWPVEHRVTIMDALHPFVKLPEYPFVICKICQYAYIANEAETHLRRHHRGMGKGARSKVIYEVKAIPGIIRSQERLRHFALPESMEKPIPFIKRLQTDGLRCEACPYVARQPQRIQDHSRTVHGWKNDRKRNENFKSGSREDWAVPWRKNFHCQRLFQTCAASGWFEVQEPSTETPKPEQKVEVMAWIKQFHDTQEQRFKDAEKEAVIEEVDQKLEANAWLGRVGWSTHLNMLDTEQLRTTTEPAGDPEGALRQMRESLDRAMESARGVYRGSKVGVSAFFEKMTPRSKSNCVVSG